MDSAGSLLGRESLPQAKAVFAAASAAATGSGSIAPKPFAGQAQAVLNLQPGGNGHPAGFWPQAVGGEKCL